jgi:heme/copper-type cytochrome/quinol oxidase subunit 2
MFERIFAAVFLSAMALLAAGFSMMAAETAIQMPSPDYYREVSSAEVFTFWAIFVVFALVSILLFVSAFFELFDRKIDQE